MTGQTDVKTTLNYTRDTGVEPEVYFYEPPPGTNMAHIRRRPARNDHP